MKGTAFIFTSLTFLISYFSWAQETKSVLFIGNSYTASNNLPEMIKLMAQSTGDDLIYDSYLAGGSRFLNHANNPDVLNKINSQDWDFVVLQGQSQETAFPQAMLDVEIYPPVQSLVNDIRNNNSCSRVLFYMTWGRKNGDPLNCPHAPWFCTYETMDNAIYNTYMDLAETHEAEVSPVGALWRNMNDNNYNIDFFSSDESHPSLAGSYAAALAFYTMIFDKDPRAINWNSSIDNQTAQSMKEATKEFIYDSRSDWDFRVMPEALFNYTKQNLQVEFTNLSENYDSLLWDFGDGNTSSLENPIHEFTENGSYTVSLEVYKCDSVDLYTETIYVENLSIEDFDTLSFSIYPNPTADILYIQVPESAKTTSVQILDIQGKEIAKPANSDKINVSNLNPGLYFLLIKHSNQKQYFRFVKH